MKFLKFTFSTSLFSSSKFITVGLTSLYSKSIIKPSLHKIFWQKMDTQGYSLNYLCTYTVILTIANLSRNYLCVTFSDSVADRRILGEFGFLSRVRGLHTVLRRTHRSSHNPAVHAVWFKINKNFCVEQNRHTFIITAVTKKVHT